MNRERILILGAAGRDFHNFNVFFRDRIEYEVVGFTAAQIPDIACRTYPPELSGELYPKGLPIYPEANLESIVKELFVDRCILAYSDLSYQEVMEMASRVLSAGADFGLLGFSTMLSSTKPTIAVCAVRTGAGKSPTSRYVVRELASSGLKAVVVRHPMPYGNLKAEMVQRFSNLSDLDGADLTIEEREEYEGHVRASTVVYAGVDYAVILKRAEEEADVIVWDGGNNDLPFFKPDLWITVADALRPGHELTYYPGSINFRLAHIIVINKANSASQDAVKTIQTNAARINPEALVIQAASVVKADRPEIITGKDVLVIEDGPSLTHGGLPSGAGRAAAEHYGAARIVDPRPYAVGSIREAYDRYGHIDDVLPAMGYYDQQLKDLEESVNRVKCDSIIVATPIDLRHIINLEKPSTRISYELADMQPPLLKGQVGKFVQNIKKSGML